LGERLLCKQEVIGSNPFTSTTGEPPVGRRCEQRRGRRLEKLWERDTVRATGRGAD
jgi:hypothetical protein